MLKRIISILLVLLMVASLAACGGSKEPEPANTAAPTGSTETQSEPESTEPVFADRETVDVGMFQVAYPEGWYFDADSMSKEDSWSNITFYDTEDTDNFENRVYIMANKQDVLDYRKSLYDWGIDLQECAAGNVETQSIGGAAFVIIPDVSRLFYRHEPTGITYTIEVSGDIEAENVKALLEGIQPNMDDGDNVDAPWPWEGEPFQPTLAPQMVGTFTITPEVVPFEESKWVMDIMEHKFHKEGDKLYHLFLDTLDTYDYTAEGLKYVSSTQLEDEYEYISSDNNGMLYLSQGIWEIIGVKDGQKMLQTTVDGDLAMHPSGTWGITFWVNADTQKVTINEGVMTAEPWILTGLNDDEARQGPFSMIQDIEISENHIMVAGSVEKEDGSKNRIIIFDLEGNQQLELGSDEVGEPAFLGSITGMAETANGFVALDGNMRRIHFWNKEGTPLGSMDVDDLLGTDYPWLEDMQLLEDGSLLLMLTQERADESSDELMLFKLTGF